MPVRTVKAKSPFAVAPLENQGYFEGRVLQTHPKENKAGNAQSYAVLEQRLRRPDGSKRISYNVVNFVLFNETAKVWQELVKVGDHVRVRFRATGWKPPKKRWYEVSLQIECFRVYPNVGNDLESWLADEGFWNPPAVEAWEPEAVE